MKALAASLFGLLLALPAVGQNCSGTSTGLVPVNDLGAGTYMGVSGGLYPGGVNARPAAHEAEGLARGAAVQPLDAAGSPDPAGKIVLLSVGLSNTTQEWQAFIGVSNADPNRNPDVVVVDGAQGGWDAWDSADPTVVYWNNIDARLAAAGCTPAQVQAVWFKTALRGPNGAFPTEEQSLRDAMKINVGIIKQRYPNTSICYLSSRIYAGYAVSTLNPEPWAYQSAFAVRWLIEDQLGGDPALNIDPAAGPVTAPWLSWGPYLWADGLTPRSDGLTWECGDFAADGTHPGPIARQKVATALSAHFHGDPTASAWYDGTGNPGGQPAFRELYGDGCPGTQGVPHILSNTPPFLGNPQFNLGITQARPQSQATLFLSFQPDTLQVPPCTVLVSLAPGDLLFPAPGFPSTLTTNPNGNGFFSFAIPNDPALDQLDFYAQWAVLDPQGAIGYALTRGLRAHVGP